MIFAFHLIDRPDAGDLRLCVRPEHKAYLALVAERIAFAGPLTADDGQTMLGSLLVIDFEDRAAAMQWIAEEPFTKAGLYQTVSILPFTNLWPQKAGFPAA
ncbi:YciI family protein [Verticiella sediminum]|uniref:YciI family protein n=1 Tax=Verticiella sediminum TaxID=1247510 RepID=A0A556AEA7_9BURK|nr:YciI family protein [Verticiella sediminum]TSH91216.1 YciI family protein [Verticiella sediminum]